MQCGDEPNLVLPSAAARQFLGMLQIMFEVKSEKVVCSNQVGENSRYKFKEKERNVAVIIRSRARVPHDFRIHRSRLHDVPR